VTVDVAVYGESGVELQAGDTAAALADARDAAGTTWVRVTDPDDETLSRLSDVFDLHPLSIDDVFGEVRPKTEQFDDHTFLLLKAARLARGDPTFGDEVREEPVGLFLGEGWLVTLSTDAIAAVDAAWRTIEREEPRLLRRAADFTAARIADGIVDEYFGLLDDVEDRIEAFEDDVLAAPDIGTLDEINEVRRDLLSIRKLLWPTREAMALFARGDPPQVHPDTEKYYRDVYDHVVQLVDLVETYRDLASGARDIYLNALSMSTNEVMKRLTVVATIVLPLTFVVGVYGMNFAGGPFNMPELGWTYGYPAVMLGMALVAATLVAYFRREEWL
jgi:magnesium transporter